MIALLTEGAQDMERFVVILLAALVWCAAAALFVACALAGVSEPSAVTVTQHTVTAGTEHLTTDICRPVVAGLPDDAFARTLNARITRQINTAWHEAKEYAAEWGPQTGYHCVFHAGYHAASTYGILSMQVTTYLDNGGTGMPQSVYYNVDIAECKMMTLGDLFAVHAPYQDPINTVIRDEMARDPRYHDAFAGIDDTTSFLVSDRHLYIAFAKYEIASGMAGEPQILIPTDVIKGFLKPEYQGLLE